MSNVDETRSEKYSNHEISDRLHRNGAMGYLVCGQFDDITLHRRSYALVSWRCSGKQDRSWHHNGDYENLVVNVWTDESVDDRPGGRPYR